MPKTEGQQSEAMTNARQQLDALESASTPRVLHESLAQIAMRNDVYVRIYRREESDGLAMYISPEGKTRIFVEEYLQSLVSRDGTTAVEFFTFP